MLGPPAPARFREASASTDRSCSPKASWRSAFSSSCSFLRDGGAASVAGSGRFARSSAAACSRSFGASSFGAAGFRGAACSSRSEESGRAVAGGAPAAGAGYSTGGGASGASRRRGGPADEGRDHGHEQRGRDRPRPDGKPDRPRARLLLETCADAGGERLEVAVGCGHGPGTRPRVDRAQDLQVAAAVGASPQVRLHEVTLRSEKLAVEEGGEAFAHVGAHRSVAPARREASPR